MKYPYSIDNNISYKYMDNFLYKLHTVWQIYNALQTVMYFKFVLGETRYNSEKKSELVF